MKNPEEYIKDFWGEVNEGIDSRNRYISGYDITLVIKQVQKDSYNEAIDDAVENAETVWVYGQTSIIDKQSILKLKKL